MLMTACVAMKGWGMRRAGGIVLVSCLIGGCTDTVPFGGRFEPSVHPVDERGAEGAADTAERPPVAPSPRAAAGAPATSPAAQPPPAPAEAPSRVEAAAAPRAGLVEESIAPRPAVPSAEPDEMVWPVLGAIVGPFGGASRPDHHGIDLAAPPATPVVAAEAGTVAHVGPIQGFGNVVALDHGDSLTTVYAHLDETVIVSVGEPVSKGSAIGRVGADGYLHFEIRRERDAVDPALLFRTAPAPETETASAAIDEPGRPVPLAGGSEAASGRIGAPRRSDEPRDRLAAAASPTPAAPTPIPVPPLPSPTPTAAAAPVAPVPTPTVSDEPMPPPGGEAPGALGAVSKAAAEDFLRQGAGTSTGPSDDRSGVGETAALIAANLAYVPAKLAYVAAGTVVGGFAWVLTGGAVTDVWEESLGGDFVLSREHISGERPIRFRGEAAPSP